MWSISIQYRSDARALPVLPHILAKKGEDANTPVVRLATIWFGELTFTHSF